MRRVIFVPHEQELDKAEYLSKLTQLPIQIGDSPLTVELEFNRKNIQILSIPIVKDISCHSIVHSQITFYCDITDEWVNFIDSDVVLKISNELDSHIFKPRLKEVNHVRFCPRIDIPGLYQLLVILNEEIYFQKDLEVV